MKSTITLFILFLVTLSAAAGDYGAAKQNNFVVPQNNFIPQNNVYIPVQQAPVIQRNVFVQRAVKQKTITVQQAPQNVNGYCDNGVSAQQTVILRRGFLPFR